MPIYGSILKMQTDTTDEKYTPLQQLTRRLFGSKQVGSQHLDKNLTDMM